MYISSLNKGKTSEYVYDISLDGTVVNALGMNVAKNTDGFNFSMPSVFRYTEEHPYISNGKGRNTVKGKSYVGLDADVAEFEDLYMCPPYTTGPQKMGLGVDEVCSATINFARKNYSDLMPNGKIKLVGNSIKSKKMPLYIEKFINRGIDLLLHGNGKQFLDEYYDYIEKIYNLRIPLNEIASIGKIKTSIENYKESCKQLTAGGTKKARQAWYELAIKNNLSVDMGDTIYYINTGIKKTCSDVQRITHYYAVVDGERKDMLKDIEKAINKYKKENPFGYEKCKKEKMTKLQYAKHLLDLDCVEEDELVFNCVLLPNSVIEDEDPHYCDDNFEYNVDKYIEMFNKRIKPLLVCFSRDIRTTLNEKGKEVNNILINNPKDRKEFTEDQCVLVSGQPYNVTDQDTYEQLMTMEDKEIKFWLSIGEKPPYTEECCMVWDDIVNDYAERMKKMEEEGVKNEKAMYDKIISELKRSDVDALIDEGIIPESLLKIVDIDINGVQLISKNYDVPLGDIYDILDKNFEEYDE